MLNTYRYNYISAGALKASGASAEAIYSFASSEAKLTSPKSAQNAHFSVVRGNSSWSDQTKNYSSNDRQDMSLALRAWHFEWHFPSPPTVESMICHPTLFTRGQL